jgi:hypothetical protein
VIATPSTYASRHAWPLLGVCAWLLVMSSQAEPRNTGDSSEYLGMAINLAAGRPPSLSEDELRTLRAAQAHGGFELESRRIPEMRGADGRYDMPHMWVYPLLATPGVWVARMAGAAPAWGLVFTNLVLVAGLVALIVWRGGGAWALTIVVTPLVWWVDKPLAEVMIACGVGAAALLFPSHAGLTLVVLGILAAQNPALLVGCLAFGVAGLVQDRQRLRDWRWLAAAATGALCAMAAPAYYLWRLDRLSPLTSYTEAALPTASALLYPLLDVNMGVFVRFPPALAIVWLPLIRREAWRMPAAWPSAATAAMLLVVCSQQPNMNQGGNPDLSRYAMWLLPLTLPWLLSADAAGGVRRAVGLVVLVLAASWTAVAFPLSRPESYRYPTRLAAWLWTQHPAWTTPRPEAFAERTSHREPAVVPTATAGCEKVLLYEGLWPAACPPSYAEVPERCSAPGMFCYANLYGHGMHLVQPFGTVAGYRPEGHDRGFRAGDPVAQWVANRAGQHQAGEQESAPAFVRGAWNVGWTQAWSSDRALVVYVRDAGPSARLAVRTRRPVLGLVESPDGRIMRRLSFEKTRDEPAVIELPVAPHLLVWIYPRPW